MEKYIAVIKYLASHMDEYTYEQFGDACQQLLDDYWADKTIFTIEKEIDAPFLADQLRNLQSLYRFIYCGQIC